MNPATFESAMRNDVKALAARLAISEDRAFAVWYAIEAFRLDEEEAREAASYDGGNDRGIDLFYVDDEAERVVIGQTKYLKNSQKCPKAEEMTLLFNTLNELDDPQEHRDSGRTDLADAAEEYLEARKKGYAAQLQFIYPGVSSNELDRLARQFNRKNLREGVSVSTIRFENLHLVHEDYTGTSGRVHSGRLEIEADSYFEQDGDWGPSLVATIPGLALKALYQAHGDRLFDQNVRLFLGTRKGSVNAGLQDTLGAPAERVNFWAYNNGITIVARDFKLLEDEDAVEMTDFSVVNGCQTTVSIANATDAAAEKASVVGRIMAAKPELVEKIIRFTNSQTPINVWDLSAREKLQHRLKEELAALDKPWFYALRRGEFDTIGDKDRFGPYGKRRVLQFSLAAQYLAALRGLPVEAYKDKARLFTAHKDKVFPNETKGSDLLWAWALGQEAEAAIREYRAALQPDDQDESILRRGARFFVTAVAADLLRERNGEDVFAKVEAERVSDKAMKDRLRKYSVAAVSYYVEIMRDLLDSGQDDLATLLRRPDTAPLLERRLRERMFREKLAPKALDEMLPKLPGIAK